MFDLEKYQAQLKCNIYYKEIWSICTYTKMTDLSAIYPCTLHTMSVYTERSKLLQYDITLSHGGTKPASHRHKIKFRDSAKPRTFGPYRELIF